VRIMKRLIVELATAVLVSGGLGLAGLGLDAPSAQANPGCPSNGSSCQQWCPGDPDPAGRPIPWDKSVCHQFYWDYYGLHDIGTGAFYAWNKLPFK
jgi:hypothetical protein